MRWYWVMPGSRFKYSVLVVELSGLPHHVARHIVGTVHCQPVLSSILVPLESSDILIKFLVTPCSPMGLYFLFGKKVLISPSQDHNNVCPRCGHKRLQVFREPGINHSPQMTRWTRVTLNYLEEFFEGIIDSLTCTMWLIVLMIRVS